MQFIETCTKDTWVEREMYWVDYYRKLRCNLVNTTDGGDGTRGRPHTEEAKQKIRIANSGERNANYGKKMSQEQKDKISKARIGLKMPDEYKKRRKEQYTGEGNPFYGKHHTEETKQKNKEGHIGKYDGEKNPSAKLTESQAKDIKYSSLSYGKLMKVFNVGKTTVAQIKTGKTWKHI